MIENKIIGITLLVLGLLMIFGSILYTYNMIQGKVNIPQVFFSQEEELEASGDQMEDMVKQQIQNILPQSNIYKLLNMIVWAIFAWIVIIAGTKVSSLGIKMLK